MKATLFWVGVLLALTLVFFFLPSAEKIPDWVFVAGLVALIVGYVLFKKHREQRS